MRKFVMFGQNPMFGDYADLADALGGRLSRVVVNVPDPPRANIKSFADRVVEYNAWLAANGDAVPLEVVDIGAFKPDPEETAVLGFRGLSSRPLRERVKREFEITFPPLIHPTAFVSPLAQVGEGTVVCSLADIGAFAKIGAFGVLNRCASIGHDTIVGDDVDISPNAALGSNIRVGDGARVGINSTVIEGLTLGEYCYVGAGAAVIRDVPPGVLVAGVPAVVKKKRG
jgi:sugar O-acyltransferase (sialic acid O-acetyltransferase NeuD family)